MKKLLLGALCVGAVVGFSLPSFAQGTNLICSSPKGTKTKEETLKNFLTGKNDHTLETTDEKTELNVFIDTKSNLSQINGVSSNLVSDSTTLTLNIDEKKDETQYQVTGWKILSINRKTLEFTYSTYELYSTINQALSFS